MSISEDALDALKETSRTFFLPISHLPGGLQEAVMASYLCLRAIDEIEDHPRLDSYTKARLLRAISCTLQTSFQANDFAEVLENCWEELPEVTRRVGDWAMLAPISIAPRIWSTTARMAECMAQWAIDGWTIQNEVDLDRYAFEVAGAVGLLTSDLWVWYDGTLSNRALAIGFGRGLQTVNILRNHAEDMARGVDFFPRGWQAEDMLAYARRNLAQADAYTSALPPGPARDFCTLPLALAYATLDALERGESKLSRGDVLQIMSQVSSQHV